MAPDSKQFPRHRRLTRGSELGVVREKGKRVRTRHLEVRALASPSSFGRVGIIVGKSKRTIIERNKLRRRLRELVRLRLLPRLRDTDVVIRTYPEAYLATYEHLSHEIDIIVRALVTLPDADR